MEMTMLRRSIARLALAAAIALPGLAQARDVCAGADMLPQIEAERPGAVAAMRAAAAAAPNAEGRFWRITAPGLAPSYLFGTLHGTPGEGVSLPPEALEAIRSARVVYTEITDAEQAAMQAAIAADIDLIADRRGGTLDAALTPEMRAVAAEVLPDYGLTYAQANVLRPWFIQVALATPPCAMAAIAAGAEVLDAAIAAAGRDAGVPVKGLETWRQAISFFVDQPIDEAREGVALTFAVAARTEDVRRTTVDLWRAGETMMVWELSRELYAMQVGQAEADAAMQDAWDGLVVARNAGFLTTAADDLHAGGVFMAVGALHLPGAGGVIEGLRAKGFEVTRISLQ
jgi:uncharacterized protein YbaP (TraB family)